MAAAGTIHPAIQAPAQPVHSQLLICFQKAGIQRLNLICFAITIGALWEVFEFGMDQLFGLNMQKSGLLDTMGDLIGFFYMFMLMVQGSLFFTRAHLNRYWTVSLELMVAAHGTLVAVQQGNGIWPMFFFGFVGIFVITQMHGLRWPAWLRWATLAAYLAFMAWVYAGRGLANLNEVIRIPLIEYLLVFILVGLVLLIAKGVEALRPSRAVVATES